MFILLSDVMFRLINKMYKCVTYKRKLKTAPGEDRTHKLGIAPLALPYKYRALTDCATGASAAPVRRGALQSFLAT